MKTQSGELFAQHLEKTEALLRKKEVAQGSAMVDFLKVYQLFSKAISQTGVARHHLIALTVMRLGAGKEESAGGFIDSSNLSAFNHFADAMTAALNPKASCGNRDFFSNALFCQFLALLALIEMGSAEMKKGEEKWRNELLLRTLFRSCGPQMLLENAALALTTDEKKLQFAKLSMEAVAIAIALSALIDETRELESLEALKEVLIKDLNMLLNIEAGSVERGLLQQLLLSLERQDLSQTFSSFNAILEENGTDLKKLKLNLKEVRETLRVIFEAYNSAKEQRPNLLHLVG